jgi:hypothetical protein
MDLYSASSSLLMLVFCSMSKNWSIGFVAELAPDFEGVEIEFDFVVVATGLLLRPFLLISDDA